MQHIACAAVLWSPQACNELSVVQRTEEQRQEARENAARNLTNIDQEERNRRIGLGVIMLVNLLTFLTKQLILCFLAPYWLQRTTM